MTYHPGGPETRRNYGIWSGITLLIGLGFLGYASSSVNPGRVVALVLGVVMLVCAAFYLYRAVRRQPPRDERDGHA